MSYRTVLDIDKEKLVDSIVYLSGLVLRENGKLAPINFALKLNNFEGEIFTLNTNLPLLEVFMHYSKEDCVMRKQLLADLLEESHSPSNLITPPPSISISKSLNLWSVPPRDFTVGEHLYRDLVNVVSLDDVGDDRREMSGANIYGYSFRFNTS